MDEQGLYSLQKKNQWSKVEDFLFLATMTSGTGVELEPRLKVRDLLQLNSRGIHCLSPSPGNFWYIPQQHFAIIPTDALEQQDLGALVPFMLKVVLAAEFGYVLVVNW